MSRKQAQRWANMMPSQRSGRPLMGVYDLMQDDIYNACFANPYGAQDYYVDGNAVASGDGKTMATAMNTLSEAITASNTSIGLDANRWWARRNRIFVCGDQEITENLTILPEKTDIIGFGYDVESMPRITGTHVIAAVATGKARGTRFINCGFMDNAGDRVFKFTTDHMAVEFHGCLFWPLLGGTDICIWLSASNRAFKMLNCRVMQNAGDATLFAEGIKIDGTAQHDMVIANNYIYATEGIHIAAGTQGYNGIIDNNLIRATVLTVNDASDLWIVSNNDLITDVTITVGTPAEGCVCNQLLASGNRLGGAGAGASNAEYPLPVVLTA